MLLEEAKWFNKVILEMDLPAGQKILNFGSKQDAYLKRYPYIKKYIDDATKSLGHHVLNLDLDDGPGVDLSGNILDPRFKSRLDDLQFDTIYLFNVLEHVSDIPAICKSIEDILELNGLILVSVPYDFPPHDDPIDNGFRPTPKELIDLFSRSTCIKSEIVIDHKFSRYLVDNRFLLTRYIARLFTPFYRPRRWHQQIAYLKYLRIPFSVTCAVFKKTDNLII